MVLLPLITFQQGLSWPADPCCDPDLVLTSVSVMSILSKAVVLKDGEPRSLACTSRDHVKSLPGVML